MARPVTATASLRPRWIRGRGTFAMPSSRAAAGTLALSAPAWARPGRAHGARDPRRAGAGARPRRRARGRRAARLDGGAGGGRGEAHRGRRPRPRPGDRWRLLPDRREGVAAVPLPRHPLGERRGVRGDAAAGEASGSADAPVAADVRRRRRRGPEAAGGAARPRRRRSPTYGHDPRPTRPTPVDP